MTEQEKRELVIEMTKTPGWRIYVDDVRNQREALNDVTILGAERDLFFARGFIDMADRVINLEAVLEAVEEENDESS